MPGDGKKAVTVLGIVGLITTAIIFAIKAKAKPPPPPPGKANLYGKVTDAETGKAISNTLVTFNGMETLTDTSGNYALTNLEPGGYYITFEKEEYEMVSGDITLDEGDNLLNIGMTPVVVPPPMANLFGIVTDVDTGDPLSGVKVTINGQVTYTDTSGAYAFVDLVPGSYVVAFEKAGYETEVR